MKSQPPLAPVRTRLLRWYGQHRRDLPWRRTRDPYAIAVSEVMLQQTQVERVKPKFEAWLQQWPTWKSLAAAPLADVLKAWSGLGYNSRAVRLRLMARDIVTKYKSKTPDDVTKLQNLPGVGEYTAQAIATFAFKQRVGVIDTNVRRVLGRIFFGVRGPKNTNQLRELVDRIVPMKEPGQWNHALMDFGSMVCTSRPKCEICPLQQYCLAYPKILSVTRPRRPAPQRFEETDRFWRGRIVALVSEVGKMTEGELAKLLNVHGVLPTARRRRLLSALRQSGILGSTQTSIEIAQ